MLSAGLAHFNDLGIDGVEVEVSSSDDVTRRLLTDRGFTIAEESALTECWLDAGTLPEISPLPDGYRVMSRAEADGRPHHMNRDGQRPADERLSQSPLDRPALDLFIVDADDNDSAFAMFWFDPATQTGVVEPVGTAEGHQRQGLARHLLTVGLDRIARLGAERISIGYEPANPASSHLYRNLGFVPDTTNDLWAGPTGG